MSRMASTAKSLLFACLLIVPGQLCRAQAYQQNTAISWNFSTATTALGWTPVASLSHFGIQNGALAFTATSTAGVYSPSFSVPAASMQLVEILMSSDTAGPAIAYWAPTQSGFGTFPGVNNFTLVGDGLFHHYYLPIDTSSATTVYQLGLNVPPGATVSIQSVALANLIAPTGPGAAPVWQFSTGTQGWVPWSGVFDMSVTGGQLVLKTYANSTILAPAAQVTNQLEWFSLMGAVTQTTLETPWIQFSFASTVTSGNIANVYFPVVPDSAQHVYNLNVGGASGWFATVSQLSITVSENTTVAISEIQVATAPQGPADLALDACGPASPLIRAGSPFQVSCRVSDRGAQPVQGLSVNLALPGDGSVKIVSSPAVPSSLTNGYPQTLTWTLIASQAETIQISALATSPNGGSAQGSTTMLVNPSVPAQTSSYVPLPVPVHSDYDIGMFYFPGWNLDSHWDPIRDFPERMPALGYYAEGDPKVLDWQIKWAVEHAIKFFAVDWSWLGTSFPPNEQGEQPNPFLQAYPSARYRDYIQYCIAYGNNIATATAASTAEFLEITQTWISKYFSSPGYYTINKAPVVFVLNPTQLETNLGGSAEAALNAARQFARSAGLPGIYFIASTNGSTTQEVQLLADGYDALSSYSYGNAGYYGSTGYVAPDPDESPYSLMVTGYEGFWDALTSASTVPYLIPTGTDWDPRPDKPFQYGGYVPFIRTGSTAAQYQTMLQAAKERIDAGQNPPIVMADAWNERGEGHWSEPSAGFGFSYLDAIRSVFANNSPHTDLGPTDVGLPLLQTVPSTALWTFTDPSDLVPWQVAAGSPFSSVIYDVSNSQISGNQWTFTTGTNSEVDRASFEFSAQNYSAVAIRLSVSADLNVNVYWGAVDEPGSSALRNVGFQARAGGMETYTLMLAGQPGWRGIVNSIRITFVGPANTNVAIQSIEFIPSSTAASIVASRSQMQFTTTLGRGTHLESAVVSLASPTAAAASWSATSNASWLTLSSESGTTPANITVSTNPAGLSIGVHQATVSFASSGGASTVSVPVTLWVTPAAARETPRPIRPPR